MNRRVLIFLISMFLLITPCLAKKYYNTPFLEKVERTPASTTEIAVDSNNNTYKDQVMTITWEPAPRGFSFELINTSSSSFTILWSECYISDSFNKYTIVHAGVKSVRNLPPSSVGAGKSLSDFFYPAAFARHVRGRYTEIRQKTIYKKKFKEKEAKNFNAVTYTATMTVQTTETLLTYKFYFKSKLLEK